VWLFVPAIYSIVRVIDVDVGFEFARLSEAVELVFSAAVLRVAFAVRSIKVWGRSGR
jgi:hypothetical protein